MNLWIQAIPNIFPKYFPLKEKLIVMVQENANKMIITPQEMCFTWAIQQILICLVRFYYLEEMLSNDITYRSLPHCTTS